MRARLKLCFAVVTVVCFFPVFTNIQADTLAANTDAVGSLNGNFQVDQSGAATYSIPITVVPGTNKMEPALSVSYSSNSGDGLMGMGFSLQGLTAITRCSSNMIQNGSNHGVDFSNQDRFCLNGQQLVAVNGSYGADQTVYRTFVDTFTKTVSYGAQGNGPTKFKVWTKGGQVAEYGFTSDSQQLAGDNQTVGTWSLDKISDTVGNYLTFHYGKDTEGNLTYPSEIDYTGNSAAELTPYNKVKFIYADRPDASVHYHAGTKTILDKRMSAIEIYSADSLVYTYKFTYDQSQISGRSRLVSVQKCTGSGVCMPATMFSWQSKVNYGWQSVPGYTPPTPIVGDKGKDLGVRFVDLLGNGLPDMISDYGTWANSGSGWTPMDNLDPPIQIVDSDGNSNGVRFIDLNGNGKLDIIQNNGSVAHAWENIQGQWVENNNFKPPISLERTDHQDSGVRFVDINNDAMLDIVVRNGGAGDAWIHTKDGWKENSGLMPPTSLTASESIGGHTYIFDAGVRFVDLNGDGLPDAVQNYLFNGDVRKGAWINTGTGWVRDDAFIPPVVMDAGEQHDRNNPTWSVGSARMVDLNGDFAADLVKNDGSSKGAWLNTGKTWMKVDNYTPPVTLADTDQSGGDEGVRFIDLNGDGRLDMVQNNGSNKGAWLNLGGKWQAISAYTPPAAIVTKADSKTYDNGVRFADLNGDGLMDMVQNNGHDKGAWLNIQRKTDLVSSITTGLGDATAITYKPLTDQTVYSVEDSAEYPDTDVDYPLYVVAQTSEASISNMPGLQEAQHIVNYHYQGAKVNHEGWGVLNFQQTRSTDVSSGISVTKTYGQDTTALNQGKLLSKVTRLQDGTVIYYLQNTWALKTFGDGTPNNTYYLPYISETKIITRTKDGITVSTKDIQTRMDDYGNPLMTINKIYDSSGTYQTETINSFTNNADKWILGNLTSATVTVSANGVPSQTRTSSFDYDPDTGMLTGTTIEPTQAAYTLHKKFTRNQFGEITTTTLSDANNNELRTAGVTYDAKGRFVVKETNALNQSVTQETDQRFGTVTQSTDLNGVTATYSYDDFGRLIKTFYPDGKVVTITYAWCTDPGDPAGAVYKVSEQISNETTTTVYYDKLCRKIATSTQSYDNKIIWETYQYDELGRIVQKSQPFFAGDTPQYVTMQYDPLGRVTQTTSPDGSTICINYNGNTTTVTNASGQTLTKTVNPRGKLIETVDNLGNRTWFYYDSYGHLTATRDSGGNVTSMTYDLLGRKLSINDPDKGQWHYGYNVFGKLVTQTDPLGNTTTFSYDKLGRLISRTDPGGTSTWEYDTASHGVGKIAKINGVASLTGAKISVRVLQKAAKDGIGDYSESFTYDELSRPIAAAISIDGQNYTTTTSYTTNSRPDTINYPGSVAIKKHYDSFGFLTQITNAVSGQLYWQLNAMDASGHITSETHSNGLVTQKSYDQLTGSLTDIDTSLSQSLQMQKQLLPIISAPKAGHKHLLPHQTDAVGQVQSLHYNYDKLGNVTERSDGVDNITENFSYDGLNRLTEAASDGESATTYKYDDLGNLTYKSDVGSYSYSKVNAGPHAVTSISGTLPATFTYNARGDQISAAINGDARTISYTSFSKPKVIANSKGTTAFYYSAARNRYKRVDKTIDGSSTTTLYLGSYVLVTHNDNGNQTTEQKYYLGSSTEYVKYSDGSDATYELLTDSLGSLTVITDINGNVLQRFHYTPFGLQQQVAGKTLVPVITHHGFSNHETIELSNLIHMNGRLYDPLIGRFLSADPTIQDPSNSQSLNRYSYCINNPLTLAAIPALN